MGHNNVAVDAFSRLHEPSQVAEAFLILSMPHFKFLHDLKIELTVSEEFQSTMTRVHDEPLQHPEFDIRD